MRNVIRDVAVKLDPSSSGCEIRCDGDGRLWCPSLSLSSSSELISSELISSELVSSERVSSELISSELISSELISSELVSSGLVSSELVSSELVSSELVSSELSSLELVSSELVSSELVSSELISSELISSELISSELISSELISSELISSELVSSELVSSELISSGLVSSEVVSSELVSSIESLGLISSELVPSELVRALYTLCPIASSSSEIPVRYEYIPLCPDPVRAQPVSPLQKAIMDLAQGPQTYTFTWSIIPPGVAAGPYTTVEAVVKTPFGQGDDFDASAAFIAEAAAVMAMWKDMFQSVFSVGNGYANQLTLNFKYEGIETGYPPATATGIQSYMIPRISNFDILESFSAPYDNVGEIRISMHEFERKYEEELGDGSVHIYYDESHVFFPDGVYSPWSNEGGDIHIRSSASWRRETDIAASGFNVRTFLLRDIGHALGFDHWGVDRKDSIMRETLYGKYNLESVSTGAQVMFPDGWVNNPADRCMVEKVYGPGNEFPGV